MSQSIESINQKFEPQCVIHNNLYPQEYLFTTKEHYTTNEKLRQSFIKRNVCIYPLYKIINFNRITWTFIPVKNKNHTFLIKNNKFNDYLCAFNKTRDLNGIKPILNKLNQNGIETHRKCIWKLEKVDSNKRLYYIWNFEYNQPIYSSSVFIKKNSFKRGVYLWPKTVKSSKNLPEKFIWIIDCINGQFLWSKKVNNLF